MTTNSPSLSKTSVTSAKLDSISALAHAAPKPVSEVEQPNGYRRGEDQRRRSQRVLLRVRAVIYVVLGSKETELEVMTLSVNAHGALVAARRSLPVDTKLVLEHGGTRERVACRVVRPPREMPEGFHTALEFSSPAPDFWKIAFPPADWMPTDS